MLSHRSGKNKSRKIKSVSRTRKVSPKEVVPENDLDAFSEKQGFVSLQQNQTDSEKSEDDLDSDQIMALNISESESESENQEGSDDDDNDEDDDYIEEAESIPKNERREKKIMSEDAIATAWGKKRNIFYGSEAADFEIDSESENEAGEEEEEALRLQNLMFSKMDESDFGADDLPNFTETDLTSAFPDLQADSKLVPALDAMTSEEKLRQVAKDSPELLGLIQELTKTMTDLKEKIAKGADQQVEGASPECISLLAVQHHLLLHYCVCLVFYLLMKAEGRPVRGHPIIDRLITIRTILERISPLRSKITYMVDKIIRQEPKSSDPLRFKPSAVDLSGEDSEADSHSDDEVPVSANDSKNVYVPPKLLMVPYKEKNNRVSKKEERKLKKLHGSEFMQSLREEFSSAPEQLQTHNGSDCESEDERERRQFEEENFLRLSDAKKKKKTSSIAGEFNDFEDISGLLGNKDSDTNDDDELQALRKAKSRAKSCAEDKSLQSAIAVSSAFDDFDDDDFDFYKAAKKKADKVTKKAERQTASKKEVKYVEDIAEGRRGASKKIVENRGIKRYRNKDDKNPRVKHRRRFEKAMVKRKGLVKEFSQKNSMGYGGESTGIKPHLSRSTSFK